MLPGTLGLIGWLGWSTALLVLVVIAGVKANDGVAYRYPFTWRPIK